MIYVVLPVFNEEQALGPLLEKFWGLAKEHELHIFAVDDGSSDGSARVLAEWASQWDALTPLGHDRNQGLGRALQTGLNAALEAGSPGDCILTMDADDTHDPAFTAGLLERIRDGADIAIASRFEDGGQEVGVPGPRRLLSRGGALLLSLLFGLEGVRDYTCGYRMYRWELLARIREQYGASFIEEDGFACMAELLLKAGSAGARFAEAPFILRYDRKASASKMAVLKTMFRTLRVALQMQRKYGASGAVDGPGAA